MRLRNENEKWEREMRMRNENEKWEWEMRIKMKMKNDKFMN